MKNPWNLTPREAETITAICETGSLKGAALELGISPKTIENHVRNAREKSGMRGNKMQFYIAWDRLQRGAQ